MSAPAHAGPAHAADCLAGWGAGIKAACRCPRGDWLDESVPRSVARSELLAQLRGWALEQRTFDRADLETHYPRLAGGAAAATARHGITAAIGIASAVWERVGVGALNMRRECESRPAAPPPAPPAYLAAFEHDYVAMLNAVLASGTETSDGDVNRWRGQAEALRQVCQRIRAEHALPEADYGSTEWRAANGVYQRDYLHQLHRVPR